MATLIVLLALTVIIGLAAFRGWTNDSRDDDFGVGRIIDWHPQPHRPA
jgi:hypothetical protein